MKKENSRKLVLEKFKIAMLNNPEVIKGGTDTSDNGETQTDDKGENSTLICTSTNTNGNG